MTLGAQLYTAHALCETTEGLAETLARVADIGYKTVQVSGVCPYDPAWLKEELDKNGLTCPLTHIAKADLMEKTDEVMENHRILDCRYVGLGGFGFPHVTVEEMREQLLPVAQKLHENGFYFMYHNHHYEFGRENGERIINKILSAFPAEVLGVTLDTFWAQVGCADPAEWVSKLKGRIPCLHLKDGLYEYNPEEKSFYCIKMAPVGEGNMNFSRILTAAEAAGTEYLFVEQDNCYGEDPIDCLKRSYTYLHSLGLQ